MENKGGSFHDGVGLGVWGRVLANHLGVWTTRFFISGDELVFSAQPSIRDLVFFGIRVTLW